MCWGVGGGEGRCGQKFGWCEGMGSVEEVSGDSGGVKKC